MNTPENNPAVTPVEQDWASRDHVQTVVVTAATILGIYLCYRLTIPFLPALAWAVALAVVFVPLQRRLESMLKNPGLAAMVSVLVIGLIVVVPATFLGQRLVMQAAEGAELVEAKVKSGEWRRALDAQPQLGPIADAIEQQIDLPGTLKTFGTWLSTTAGSIVKGSVFQLIGLCLTFYLLFFFLRDRASMLRSLRALSPLSTSEMDRLIIRVGDTVYATVYGTLAVAALQGLLGGLMFWWLGLSAPLLWGVVMAVLAVVPILGAFVVWLPAAIYLALEGNWEHALILSAWGTFVVGTIDNLVRPILVGNRLKLHTVLAFMAVVGGLILFGAAGLILGPVILTVTLVLLETWRSRFGLPTQIPVERLLPTPDHTQPSASNQTRDAYEQR
ncbi:MAG: AI-2E family transporter [Aeromicrobium sp.]|nr:AI-2E family transporter [Burkholderiales bacterium]